MIRYVKISVVLIKYVLFDINNNLAYEFEFPIVLFCIEHKRENYFLKEPSLNMYFN
jgi:hypothetical protein